MTDKPPTVPLSDYMHMQRSRDHYQQEALRYKGRADYLQDQLAAVKRQQRMAEDSLASERLIVAPILKAHGLHKSARRGRAN